MGDQERLLRVSEGSDVPIQVSGTDGAIRGMAERAEDARADSPGSCTSWCGWGN